MKKPIEPVDPHAIWKNRKKVGRATSAAYRREQKILATTSLKYLIGKKI